MRARMACIPRLTLHVPTKDTCGIPVEAAEEIALSLTDYGIPVELLEGGAAQEVTRALGSDRLLL